VTLGQDEGGTADRPAQSIYYDSLDYTAVHTWWNNDDLLWDGVVTKSPELPNVHQETGLMSLHDKDGFAWRTPEAAARLLEALAARGDSGAALRLARAYDSGRGVPADAAQAERMYRRAAAAGEVDALYNLGVFHDKARGGARNAEEAVRWFRRAADQRDAQAQLNLGILFYKGDGVPVDHAQARAWLELAADNGNARAQDLLRVLEFRAGSRDGLPVKPTVLIDPP